MGYEEEFSKFLLTLISDVDKRIRRGEQRLVLNSQPNPIPTTPEMATREKQITQLTERINKLVEEAESLGCEGNVDLAQNAMVQCEELRTECTALIDLNKAELRQLESANEPAKAMEVCATCGALLVIGDPHQRLDEHVSGKQHKGFAHIRAYLDERRLASGVQFDPVAPPTVNRDVPAPTINDGELSANDGCYSPPLLTDRKEGGVVAVSDFPPDDQPHYYRNEVRSRDHLSSRHRSRSGDRSHSKCRHSSSPHSRHKHRHRHRHSAHASRHHGSSGSSNRQHHSHSSHRQSRVAESPNNELIAENPMQPDLY